MTESLPPLTNPYESPRAEVADRMEPALDSPPPFFHVAVWKLVVMTVSTFGVYLLYWHYRHWKAVKAQTGEDLWPVPRAIFYPLTGWDLFPRMEVAASAAEVPVLWAPWAIGASILLLNVGSRLANLLELPWLGFVGLLQVVPHAFVQATVNRTLDRVDPGGSRNGRLTAANLTWLILSVLFWGLVLLGLLVQAGPR